MRNVEARARLKNGKQAGAFTPLEIEFLKPEVLQVATMEVCLTTIRRLFYLVGDEEISSITITIKDE